MHACPPSKAHSPSPSPPPTRQRQSHGFPGQQEDSDDDTSPHSSSNGSSPTGGLSDIRTPTSSESELLCLDPPYLVPRPLAFPTPTLLVEVISAHNLKVGTGGRGVCA